VYLIKSKLGYSVEVDGFDLGLEVAWTEAEMLCKAVASGRPSEKTGFGSVYNRQNQRNFFEEATRLRLEKEQLLVACRRAAEFSGWCSVCEQPHTAHRKECPLRS
jgi:hypothetical protein